MFNLLIYFLLVWSWFYRTSKLYTNTPIKSKNILQLLNMYIYDNPRHDSIYNVAPNTLYAPFKTFFMKIREYIRM